MGALSEECQSRLQAVAEQVGSLTEDVAIVKEKILEMEITLHSKADRSDVFDLKKRLSH